MIPDGRGLRTMRLRPIAIERHPAGKEYVDVCKGHPEQYVQVGGKADDTPGYKPVLYTTQHYEHFKKIGKCLATARYGFTEVLKESTFIIGGRVPKSSTQVKRPLDGGKPLYVVVIREWDCETPVDDCTPKREEAAYRAVLFAPEFRSTYGTVRQAEVAKG